MKKIGFVLLLVLCFISSLICLTGCTSGHVDLFITHKPSKLAYQVNEEFSSKGLKVEFLNTDGTTTAQSIKKEDITGADTSSPGEKTVTITKDKYTTTFKIYVANIVISPEDNVVNKLESASSGDIVYFLEGEYLNSENNSLVNLIVDKSLSIVGAGAEKTVIHGNFIVGANKNGNSFTAINEFKDVKFINIGFKQDYKVENGDIKYSNGIEQDNYGAICGFNTKNLYVSGCKFSKYSYGVLMNNAENLSITLCTFNNMLLNGVKVLNNTKNVTIFKNVFTDIATDVLYSENNKQGYLSAVELTFSDVGNAGVILSNNTFTRIGLKQGGWIYFNDEAKQLKQTDINLNNMSYIYNTSIILLKSTGITNLDVTGIILSANNYGVTLQNIKIGTDEQNDINESGVIVNENF